MKDDYLSYEKLSIWEKAVDWAVDVINLVDKIDTNRKHFRLVEQLESASTSVSMNIAEGKGRWSQKEFRHYLYISRGSLYETLTLMKILEKKNWIDPIDSKRTRNSGIEINKMLNSFIFKLNKDLGDR